MIAIAIAKNPILLPTPSLTTRKPSLQYASIQLATYLLRDDRGETTEQVALAVNDDGLRREGGHLLVLNWVVLISVVMIRVRCVKW